MLISIIQFCIDCWGEVKRRYGGCLSSKYEFSRFVKIIQGLDPPSPAVKRPQEMIDRTSPIKRVLKTESEWGMKKRFLRYMRTSRSNQLQNLFCSGYKNAVNELASSKPQLSK